MPAANESVIMTMFMVLNVEVNRLRHATGEREREQAEREHGMVECARHVSFRLLRDEPRTELVPRFGDE